MLDYFRKLEVQLNDKIHKLINIKKTKETFLIRFIIKLFVYLAIISYFLYLPSKNWFDIIIAGTTMLIILALFFSPLWSWFTD